MERQRPPIDAERTRAKRSGSDQGSRAVAKGSGRPAKVRLVSDERIANPEQRDPRSGDIRQLPPKFIHL